MTTQITSLFENRPEHPLFYVESGSRLWGIASPDSDYDVRGFHLQSKEAYFDFSRHRDLIEIMEGDFDFVSYDIDKMFGLLAKSNPTVFEWIRAHIVYFNRLPDWAEVQQQIMAHFDLKALYHHYLSIAKSHIDRLATGKKSTYKTLFYGIRGLLSAELATQNTIPHLLIDRLFDQFEKENAVITIAKESLERKKSHAEAQEVAPQEKPLLLRAIQSYTRQLESKPPPPARHSEKLYHILRAYNFDLKNVYY